MISVIKFCGLVSFVPTSRYWFPKGFSWARKLLLVVNWIFLTWVALHVRQHGFRNPKNCYPYADSGIMGLASKYGFRLHLESSLYLIQNLLTWRMWHPLVGNGGNQEPMTIGSCGNLFYNKMLRYVLIRDLARPLIAKPQKQRKYYVTKHRWGLISILYQPNLHTMVNASFLRAFVGRDLTLKRSVIETTLRSANLQSFLTIVLMKATQATLSVRTTG